MPERPLPASLKAFGLNCSLKPGSTPSSTEALMQQLFQELARHDVEGEIVRAADHDIRPGVSNDEGKGDAWPGLLQKVLDADILVIGSPIWLGQPSSTAKRVLERMDAFIADKDERGRMPSYGKVAICAIVGNEDGAHHSAAEILSALLEVGFTVPSGGRLIGSARPWAQRNTRTSRRRPTWWRNGTRCWRRTPCIWRDC